MLHYQVSPPKREVKKPTEESVVPSFLTLGAFAAVPKVHFETVLLGFTKKRTLIVRNPNDTACFLKFLKKPSAAFKLTWGTDGQDILIPAAAQVEITIEWTPKEEGQCFETFQVQGSNAGASRLSVHLLGKCLPPPKRQGAKKRPVTVSSSNPSLPKPKDPSLKIAGKNLPTPKPPAKVTIPHSPNFSTRFSSRTSSSATDRNSIAPPKSVNSTPCFKVPSDKTFVSPNPLEKLTSIQFPFTPEPTQPLARREAGDCLDLTPEEPEEDILLPLKDMDPQKTFLLRQEPSNIASPSRRETYVVSPPPNNNMGHAVSQLACNTTVPQIIEAGATSTSETDSGVPPLEEVNVKKSNGHQEASTSGIELDQQVLDSITKALDDELDLKLVHRSVDRILDQVNDMGSEQQRKEIQAKFSRLTEFGDENVLMDPIDFEDDDQLGTKTSSGEFLCMDQMDLVPNFPAEEGKVERGLISSIKQMLKDGKTDDEIIAHYAESEDMVKEIRVLYDEMGNKYKSCRECYELCKAAHLSESFTFHRIVIQKAIKNNEIRLKHGVDICSFKSKTSIISSLLSSFNRPWLWSALCLVFHNDKLVADDIDMMNFIDDNLFWNNELMDGFEMSDSVGNTPKEFLDMLVPKFLQNYLEIVYLLDATGIPSVFVPNNSTKKLLDTFQAEYLEEANLAKALDRIPIKLVDTVDPIHYLIQDNLRGPNLMAWTNIVKLVQELTEGDPDKPRLTYNSSSMESMKESVTMALQEVNKLGIQCELPEEQDTDWLLYGAPSNVDEKLIWQLVLRIRIAQCKKQQGSEE